MKQLYLIDAIDENGAITSIGRTMSGMFSAFFHCYQFSLFGVFLLSQTEHICVSTELPLEPSLSRTLIEANESGCLSQALTVVAMLSAETTLLPVRGLVFFL